MSVARAISRRKSIWQKTYCSGVEHWRVSVGFGDEAVDAPAAQLLTGASCRGGVETCEPRAVELLGAGLDRNGHRGGFGEQGGSAFQRRNEGLLRLGGRRVGADLQHVAALTG